jgi:hypothetical protein
MQKSPPDRGRPGRFSSSHDAPVRTVSVHNTATGLEVRDEMGLLVAAWKTADLRADSSVPGRVRLRCAAEPGARLEVVDAQGPTGANPTRRRPLWLQAVALVAVGLALVSIPFLLRPADMVPQVPALPSPHSSYCRAPAGEAALAGLATRLTAGLPADRRPSVVAVVDSPALEIAVMPGGVVMMPVGLLRAASGPDEVAAALASALAPDAPAVLLRAAGIGEQRPPAMRGAEWQALLGICR